MGGRPDAVSIRAASPNRQHPGGEPEPSAHDYSTDDGWAAYI